MFARWCERDGQGFCPASPATVARFVKEHEGLGIAQLWPALQQISKLHTAVGLADPTSTEPVTRAVSNIVALTPPRAWPADWKERFKTLPYDLQAFIAEHEARRDKALRRAQNDAAAARQALAKHLQTQTDTKGKPTDENSAHHADS
jgi:hypothetical protein